MAIQQTLPDPNAAMLSAFNTDASQQPQTPMGIADIRQKYPQYQDLSDQQLADSLHQKYYSDMPQQQFYQKIGLSLQQPTMPPQTQDSQVMGDIKNRLGTAALNVAKGGIYSIPAAIQNVVGGEVNNIVGQGINKIMPSSVKDMAQNVANTVDAAVPSIGNMMLGASNKATQIAQQYPQAAYGVSGIINQASATPTMSAVKDMGDTALSGIEGFMQRNPEGLLASEGSGITTNAALGGIPEGGKLRIKGATQFSPEKIAETSDANWNKASDLFKSSTANGAVIAPESAQNLLDYVKEQVGGLNSRTKDTAGVLDDFEQAIKSGDVTPDKLHEFRQNFNDVISSNTKSKIDGGGINLDGKKALDAKNAISEVMTQLTQKDLIKGTPQALSDMQEAINTTAQAHRYDTISNLISDADGNPDKMINGFSKLAKKLEKSPMGYSPEEIQIIKDAGNRTGGQYLERALGIFGFDAGKLKNIALPTLVKTGALAVPGGAPLVGVGTVARQTGKFAARGKALNVLETIQKRAIK